MKNLITFSFFFFMLLVPASLCAQNNTNFEDDSYYMAGAVPEVDGKVVFQKEFNIPGMSEEQIYQRMLKWLEKRLEDNKNPNSRIVYTEPKEGLLAGVGEEWIVFKSSALSLDRTLVNYQITVTCKPEHCLFELEKIRFTYRESEKYTAEEWITDKYALNKTQTKMVKGLVKWRKKTVDFADDIFDSAAKALGAADNSTNKPIAIEGKSTTKGASVVILPNNPVVEVAPVAKSNQEGLLKEIEPSQVAKDVIQVNAGKLVIAIGNDAFNMTMMTADAGGSIGKIGDKPVVFTILSPDQPYEALEKAETYVVKFFPNGQNQPSVVLDCKKMPTQTFYEGQPRTYIGQIVKAWIRE